MPRLKKETKEKIKSLDCSVLQEIVLRLASKDKMVYQYLRVNYLEKEHAEQEIFNQTKEELLVIFRKSHKGYSQQLQLANMLKECVKKVNEFTEISNNKVLEADLLLYVLEMPFALDHDLFGRCFTQYDTKVAVILKRLINIVTKKLHEDYLIDYKDDINEYLTVLHEKSSHHIETVSKLPTEI